jgi:ubiquinone/menaquinone biosynthesis C-methylase UbiE
MSFQEPGTFEILITELLQGLAAPFVSKRFVERLQLQGDERVLDYGSGAGFIDRYIAESLQAGGELCCVDISGVWLQRAQQRLEEYPNVRFYQGDLLYLPFDEQYFDTAVIHFMLHDIDPGDRLLRVSKLSDLLQEGGSLFIREPIKESHGIPPEEIRQLMHQCGLHEVVSSIEKTLFGKTVFMIYKK